MVTLKQIANEAECSVSTVSKVLLGEKTFQPEMIKRVRSASERLGYVPNEAARRLRGKKSRLIGVLISDITNHSLALFYKHCSIAARSFEHKLMLETPDREADIPEFIRFCAQNQAKGVILNLSEGGISFNMAGELKELAMRHSLEIVISGVDDFGTGFRTFSVDNSDAYSGIINHLSERGYESATYIGHGHQQVCRERLENFYQACESQGLEIRGNNIILRNFRKEDGRLAAERLLEQGRVPRAIVCINDLVAAGVCETLTQRGFRVPQDVALIGFDDSLVAQFIAGGLTTFRQPYEKLAKGCLNAILNPEKSNGENRVNIKGELIVRATS